jgi:hypothetical protein
MIYSVELRGLPLQLLNNLVNDVLPRSLDVH